MTDLPLATVAITTYQYDAYVDRAIDSALALDWPADRLEVLVVDDGSTDRTPEVLAGYGDRIRSIRTPNRGVVAAVTLSLQEARGEIIALLAGDDEVPPDRLRRQWEVLAAQPAVGLVYGDMELIDANSATLAASFSRMAGLVPLHGPGILGGLLAQNTVSGGPSLLRASLVEQVLPMPAEAVHEDWWIALKAAELSQIAYVDHPIYRYRHHGRNMNLGAPRDRTMALWHKEVRFRRFVLRGEAIDLSGIGAAQTRDAVVKLDEMSREVAEFTGRWLHDLLGVTAADRTAADDAWHAGDPRRAIGCDPAHEGARDLLGVVALDPAPAIDVRATVTVALVSDVLAQPELFDAYRAAVGPDDDATLVLYAPGSDVQSLHHELAARVPAVLRDDAPDVLVYAYRPGFVAERRLLDRATAALTTGEDTPAGLPRFTATALA